MNGRDAHLRHHLDDALLDRFQIVRARFVRRELGREISLFLELVERVQSEIRVNGTCAIAYQQREVVHLSGIAGLHDQADLRPSPLPHQVVVEASHRYQAGHRCVLRIHAPVREDEYLRPTRDRRVCLLEERVQGRAQRGWPGVGGEEHRQHGGLECVVLQ